MMNRVILTVFVLLASLSMASGQLKHNAATPKDPASVPVPQELRGEVISGLFDASEIYPGTVRKFQVFIPQKYDGTSPACLLLGLDGNLFNAITVIDNLIRKGEMPVTIGVFVDPGVSYLPDGSVARYNRSNEFDRTNGDLAQFIETELLPHIEGLKCSDGRAIIISKNPNDRAITGASSSGIAAFTVAWERPDLFSRVYSSVGTFVAMRGGNEYPAIIRKSEPKPLRIFLQDGVNDTWNHIFGDWWEYNQLISSALNFAGYEFDFKWDRGTHSIYYGTRAYPDAMRWLWRGWPEPVQTGKSMNGMLESLLIDGEGWKETDELPAEVNGRGAELQMPSSLKRVLKEEPVCTQALADGRYYVSTHDGSIWLAASGRKPVKLAVLPTGSSQFAIYPNNRLIITSEKNSNWLISYIVKDDGSLEHGQRFYWLHNRDNHTQIPVGNMVFDTQGNLYVATSMGIQVCDQNGRVRAILAPAGCSRVDEIYLSGNRIYAFAGGKWYVRNIAHTGYDPLQGPIDVKSQGQG